MTFCLDYKCSTRLYVCADATAAVQEFCNPFGEVKFTHPNHEDHLQAYLALENQALKELNATAMDSLAAINPIQVTSMEWGRLP